MCPGLFAIKRLVAFPKPVDVTVDPVVLFFGGGFLLFSILMFRLRS